MAPHSLYSVIKVLGSLEIKAKIQLLIFLAAELKAHNLPKVDAQAQLLVDKVNNVFSNVLGASSS